MIPEPLHPAVVHFPIVLVVVLPFVVAGALMAIRRGAGARRAWLPVLAVAVALTASSWVAVQTGEGEEEAVERVVPESAIHEHEEAAELFLPLTVAGLLLISAGFLKGRVGSVVRAASLVGALGLMVAGYRVGHSGGELVYTYGAASAYASGTAGSTLSAPATRDDDDEHRRP